MTARFATLPPSLLGLALYPKVSVTEYHEMIKNGVLGEGDPVELLDGYLVTKMSRNPPHDSAVRRLGSRLPRLLPLGWSSQSQCAISLPASEPEPDAAVLRGDESAFDSRHPTPVDLAIVIEVADSSLQLDRGPKSEVYARAGIPVYWIINVVDKQIEVYTDPAPAADPPAYCSRTDYALGAAVPITLDGQQVATIPVADLIA